MFIYVSNSNHNNTCVGVFVVTLRIQIAEREFGFDFQTSRSIENGKLT